MAVLHAEKSEQIRHPQRRNRKGKVQVRKYAVYAQGERRRNQSIEQRNNLAEIGSIEEKRDQQSLIEKLPLGDRVAEQNN